MLCTIINDCRDANATGRQITRVSTLLGCPTTLVGVENDLEAAGNLIDILDAGQGSRGVVFVNVAPRNGKAKRWENGTPFGYFWYKGTLVVASIDGLTLSLAKKLGVLEEVRILEIPEIYAKSQFRSFEFLPGAARALLDGENLQTKEFYVSEVAEVPKTIWWVDNFGNCKTTLLSEDVPKGVESLTSKKTGKLPIFPSLKDVPNDTAAFVVGSSGLGDKRFLEIVIQGRNAAQELGLSSGAVIY